jgi:hypothetical protein
MKEVVDMDSSLRSDRPPSCMKAVTYHKTRAILYKERLILNKIDNIASISTAYMRVFNKETEADERFALKAKVTAIFVYPVFNVFFS